MKKHWKVIVPVLLLAATVFGSVLYTSAYSAVTIKGADGTEPVRGAFSLQKGQSIDFNVFRDGTEITADNTAYTTTWTSADTTILSVDANGVATADKDGLMPGVNGKTTLSVTLTEVASGKQQTRSYTVNVAAGSTELITTISGVSEGMPLAPGTEYTLIARTYDRSGDTLTIAANQLFCAYTCDSLTITGGKFTPALRGTYRVTVIGYATEADLAAGTNEVARDVLEFFVNADPTPTPTPTPVPATPTLEAGETSGSAAETPTP